MKSWLQGSSSGRRVAHLMLTSLPLRDPPMHLYEGRWREAASPSTTSTSFLPVLGLLTDDIIAGISMQDVSLAISHSDQNILSR